MMKKFTFLMPAIVALLASCSQEDTLQNTDEGLRPVTITASLPEVAVPAPAATRAVTATDDDDATRCLMQLVEDGIAQEVQEGTISNGSCSFTVTLNPTKDYQLMFWADNGGYAADVVHGLEKMTAKAPSANASPFGIAYAGTATWGGSELASSIDVDLQHVVGKLTLRTTEAVTGGKNYSLKIPTTFTAYDVLSGEFLEASEDGTTYDYTVPASGVAKGGDLFSIYLLAGSETQELTLTNDGAESQIPNVPLAPNKHTILKGDVQNAGHVNVTFTAAVVEEWNSEETKYIIPGDAVKITPENCSDISGDGNYVVSGEFNNQITITGGSPTIYLNGANINVSDGPAISITGGTPTIHVIGEGNSVSSGNNTGIAVSGGATVVIEGHSTADVLTANGGSSDSDVYETAGAGIGSPVGSTQSGNIIIRNVTVYATGGTVTNAGGGAGIGSSTNGSCGDIVIENASIDATGGYMAAAIGMGCNSWSNSLPPIGAITITNSYIKANAGMRAAAIGFSCCFTSVDGNMTYCAGKITITTNEDLKTFLSRLTLSQGAVPNMVLAQRIGKGQYMNNEKPSSFKNTAGTGDWEGVVINGTLYPDGIE